ASLAVIGTSNYYLATTESEQSSWNLLTKNVDLFSKNLAVGKYTLKINNKSTPVTLQPQTITLVWLTQEGCYEQILWKQVL
ncbi:hypothetical protein NAI48_11415, partial [Francisella tularensis subsp. holarctica]|nr:hypothetical protein [Francisella tularensis subsp. holarctica]